eukprot:2256296-Alexandrium_andersonii.AAC.1
MQVRLTHVNEDNFTGPAPAELTRPRRQVCQVGQEEPKCLKGRSSRKHGIVFVGRDVLGDIATPNIGNIGH